MTSFALPTVPVVDDTCPNGPAGCADCRPWSPADDRALDTIDVVLDPEPARFLVETAGRAGASRTLHLSIPRTVLLDVVADVETLAVERPDLFTGGAAGGDSAGQWCEPADSQTVALHVDVRYTSDDRDPARAALILLDRLA